MSIVKNKKLSKLKYILCLSLLLLIFPGKINAAGNIVIECDDSTLKSGQTAKCYIRAKSFDIQVSSYHGKLTISNGITLKSFVKDSIWEGGANNNVIDLYTANNKTGNFNLASFEFIVPSSTNQFTITVGENVVSDNNFNEINLSNATKVINISSGNNNNNNDNDNQNINNNPTNQNITVNPKTGFNYMIVGVIAVVSLLVLVLLLKKGGKSNNE